MNIDTITLKQAGEAIISLTTNDELNEYKPKTLQSYDNVRFMYLPLYPTIAVGPKNHLLLANVPVSSLAPHEIARRQHEAFTFDSLMIMNNYKYSNDGFSLFEEDIHELAKRLRVGKSIITFNADKLSTICNILLELHVIFRRNILRERDIALKQPTLNSKQMAILLEFYLQIDVDIFYMKTCSFRGAQPRCNLEGLFCGKDEPQGKYSMLPCDNLFCQCCHPLNQWKKSQPWPVINFASSSTHKFMNGYTTYLNCPVTCNTLNIIYAMTCPCDEYDCIDSTAGILADAMVCHRNHGNRIIHEKLTGSPLYRGSPLDPHEMEKEIINKMRLYQHSARCPIALRSFLDCNPSYRCFIPMPWDDALTENIVYIGSRGALPSTNQDPEVDNIIFMGAFNNQIVARYLDRIPIPPTPYAFSCRQRNEQRLFFEKFIPSPNHQLPYSPLDLYQMKIIAVLPDDRSIILRYIIETLFVIHGETKLNMICPLGGDPEKRYGRPFKSIWCANLNYGSVSTTASPT